jgi:hypothetical protein
MFLRDNQHDSDFSAFMSIWFYEEQKHSLVLMEYLRRFRPDFAPTEAELQRCASSPTARGARDADAAFAARSASTTGTGAPPSGAHRAGRIRTIYELISRDEARHGGACAS